MCVRKSFLTSGNEAAWIQAQTSYQVLLKTDVLVAVYCIYFVYIRDRNYGQTHYQDSDHQLLSCFAASALIVTNVLESVSAMLQ